MRVITNTGTMSAATPGTTTVNYTLADLGNHYYGVKENLPAGTTPTDDDAVHVVVPMARAGGDGAVARNEHRDEWIC